MNLGLRRGLATSAVGALAITGMATVAAPAGAVSSADVRFVGSTGQVVSSRPNGTFEARIRLVVERRQPGLEVTFEVNPDPQAADDDADWEALEAQPPQETGDYVSVLWDPSTVPGIVGTKVAVRAVVTDGASDPAYTTLRGLSVLPSYDERHTVRLAQFSGGYFEQPYATSSRTASLVGLSGTTSAADGRVAIEEWQPGSASFRHLADATVRPSEVKAYTGEEFQLSDGGAFDAVLPLAVFDAEEGETVALRARRDLDDVAPATVYRQTIGGLTYDETTSAAGSVIDLRVEDEQGRPVAGAEVRRADGRLIGYTNGAGTVTVTQPAETARTYYVNTTDTDAFEDGVDRQVSVETDTFEAFPTGMRPVLADGPAFDRDEYAAGDVAFQVTDQNGDPLGGAREVQYRLFRNGSATPEPVAATTNAAGRLVVPFDATAADGLWRIEGNSTPGDLPLFRAATFYVGEAKLTLTPASGAAASGGVVAATGRLTVAGRPMASRLVGLAYAPGGELAPGSGADAGIGTARMRTATAVTAADGTFPVTVHDKRERGRPTETGGRLTATAAAAGATASATTTFGRGKGAFRLGLKGANRGGQDVLGVTGSSGSAGERVTILVKVGKRWKAIKTGRLDGRRRLSVSVPDRDRSKASSYVARLLESARTRAASSRVEKLR